MQEMLRPFARSNLLKTCVLAAAGLLAALLWGNVIRAAAGIIFGACLLSFLIIPLARLFEKKLRRPTACILAMLLAGGSLLLVLSLLFPVMLRQITGAAELLPRALSRVQDSMHGINLFLQNRLPGLSIGEPDLSHLEQNIGKLARHTILYAGNIAGSVYRLVLTVILAYFLMADRDKVLLRAELLVPGPWRRTAVRMGNSLCRELRLYLRGQATIALCVGALAAAALAFAGIKAAPLLGLIVGMFNVIPYFGPFIGGIPAVVMALSISWQRAAITVLILFAVQQADSLVISPRVMGSITGFSPAVVLLAVFLGQQAFGVWGMLFAMPLMMSFRTVYRVFVQRHENN